MAARRVERNVAAVAIATAVAEVVTLPACALKTAVLNTPSLALVLATRGLAATATTFVAQRGVRALFAASWLAVGTQIFSTSAKWVAYRELQRATNPRGGVLASVVNGVASGVATTLVTHPLDVIKFHVQAGRGARVGFRDYSKVLYRGYSKAVAKVCVGSALFLPLYDAARAACGGNAAAGAAVSAVVSTCIMHPLDAARNRHALGSRWWYGVASAQNWVGLSLNLVRIVPHFVITMALTARLETLLR